MSLPLYPYTNMSDTNLDFLFEDNKRVHEEMRQTTEYINESRTYIDNQLQDAQASAKSASTSAETASTSAESASNNADYIRKHASQIDLNSKNIADEVETRKNADISLRQAIDALVSPSGQSVVVDSSLSVSGAAADAKVTGQKINNNSNLLNLKSNNIFEIGYKNVNVIDKAKSVDGNLATVGKRIETSVVAGQSYLISGYSYGATFPLVFIVDSANTTIFTYGIVEHAYNNVPIVIPDGGVTMIVNGLNDNPSVARIDNMIDLNHLEKRYQPNTYNKLSEVGTPQSGMINANTGGSLTSGSHTTIDVTPGDVYLVSGYSWTTNDAFPCYYIQDSNGVTIDRFGGVDVEYSDIPVYINPNGSKLTVNGSPKSTPKIYKTSGIKKIQNAYISSSILPSCSLNDATLNNGMYMMIDSNSYTDYPSTASYPVGFLSINVFKGNVLQLFYDWDGITVYERRKDFSDHWTSWHRIGDSNNTYLLESTGDSRDRTSEIFNMLNTRGVCELGEGTFYISELNMPINSKIIGKGKKTTLLLLDGDNKYAIKLNSGCLVTDVIINGNLNGYTPASNIGTRYGLEWVGNYSSSHSYDDQPKRSIITNVWFENLSAGLYCNDTGDGVQNNIQCDNIYAYHCDVGIYIKSSSEYNKFNNCSSTQNYYGVINNGGNNMFTNCDFSLNKLGCLIDNTNNQSPNHGHGSMVSCQFNHSDSNAGIGIKLINCKNGFTFVGCQVFYSKINLIDSDGIIVSDSILAHNTFEITNGGASLFTNSMFMNQPTLNITNNQNIHFSNCYIASTGDVVTN